MITVQMTEEKSSTTFESVERGWWRPTKIVSITFWIRRNLNKQKIVHPTNRTI